MRCMSLNVLPMQSSGRYQQHCSSTSKIWNIIYIFAMSELSEVSEVFLSLPECGMVRSASTWPWCLAIARASGFWPWQCWRNGATSCSRMPSASLPVCRSVIFRCVMVCLKMGYTMIQVRPNVAIRMGILMISICWDKPLVIGCFTKNCWRHYIFSPYVEQIPPGCQQEQPFSSTSSLEPRGSCTYRVGPGWVVGLWSLWMWTWEFHPVSSIWHLSGG